MSRKICVVAMFVAALVVSVAASGASATLFLKGGVSLTKGESCLTDGVLFLTQIQAGTKVRTTGSFHGLCGPGAEDTVELALGLSSTEKDLVTATVITGGFPPCGVGGLVELHALKLPWATHLVLEGGSTYDKVLNAEWLVLCFGVDIVTCKTTEARALFEGNGASGAKLNYKKEAFNEKGTCSNGETAGIESEKGEVLGFTVS